jgi:hypothetical protein
MPIRVEPMTIRQLLLRDGVGGQGPALFGSWVSFDTREMYPRAIVCLQAPRRHLTWSRMPFAVALSTLKSPAHRWCDPVQ